jgi:hypothetical protein
MLCWVQCEQAHKIVHTANSTVHFCTYCWANYIKEICRDNYIALYSLNLAYAHFPAYLLPFWNSVLIFFGPLISHNCALLLFGIVNWIYETPIEHPFIECYLILSHIVPKEHYFAWILLRRVYKGNNTITKYRRVNRLSSVYLHASNFTL